MARARSLAPAQSGNRSEADDATAVFAPIVGSKAAGEVADQITFAILSGRYPVGSRLPTLPALAKAMGVSLPVVGEAVGLLRSAGVLEVKRGSSGGISVRSSEVPTSATKLSRPRRATSLRAIVEARRPIEMELARYASTRATESDIAELEDVNARLVQASANSRQFIQIHNAFHYTMGRAASNPLLAYFQHELLEELALMLDGLNTFMDPKRTIREHRNTLAALRSRDPDIAAQAMDEHLSELEVFAADFDARPKRRAKRASHP